jgi:hypothetical protein
MMSPEGPEAAFQETILAEKDLEEAVFAGPADAGAAIPEAAVNLPHAAPEEPSEASTSTVAADTTITATYAPPVAGAGADAGARAGEDTLPAPPLRKSGAAEDLLQTTTLTQIAMATGSLWLRNCARGTPLFDQPVAAFRNDASDRRAFLSLPKFGEATYDELVMRVGRYRRQVAAGERPFDLAEYPADPPSGIEAAPRLAEVTVADLIRVSDVSMRLGNMLFRTDAFEHQTIADMLEGRFTEADILRLPDLGRTTYRELRKLVDDYVAELSEGRDILAVPEEPAQADISSAPASHPLDGLTVGDLSDRADLPIRIANRLAREPGLRSFPLAALASEPGTAIEALKRINGLGGRSVEELVELVGRLALDPSLLHLDADEASAAAGDETVLDVELATPQEQAIAALAALDDRRRQVVEARFGLDGQPPRTLQDIAEKAFVTRERVRQVEKKALQQLSRRPWRRGFERILAERQAAAWARIAGDDAMVPADEAGSRTRDVDPLTLLAVDVVHGSVRAWLDSFATPAPGGWLPHGGSADVLKEDAKALRRAIDAAPLPRPFQEICREAGLDPAGALPAFSLISGHRLHEGYVHAGHLGSKARRAARMHRMALENGLQVFDLWRLAELDAAAAHDDDRSPRMIAAQLDENPHLFHRIFDSWWAVLPAQGGWPGDPLALPALSQAPLPVTFEPGSLSAWLHDTLAREGPQRHVDLRARAVQHVPGISKASIGPILLTHPVFVRCAPGVYALRSERYVGVSDALLTTGQARTYARALRSGVTRNQFPAWGGEFEWRICEWARNGADGDVFRSLLHVSSPEAWPATDAMRGEWRRLRQLHGRWMLPSERRSALGPEGPSPAEFLSGVLHVALLGSIGWIGAGRVAQARLGDQGPAHLLALLGACGAIDCPEDWQASHLAGPRIQELLHDLTLSARRQGELSWSDPPLSDLLADAAASVEAVRWADPDEVRTMIAALQGGRVRGRKGAEARPGGPALAGVDELFASEDWGKLFEDQG